MVEAKVPSVLSLWFFVTIDQINISLSLSLSSLSLRVWRDVHDVHKCVCCQPPKSAYSLTKHVCVCVVQVLAISKDMFSKVLSGLNSILGEGGDGEVGVADGAAGGKRTPEVCVCVCVCVCACGLCFVCVSVYDLDPSLLATSTATPDT